jgi:type I restriction enzyme S subunit
MRYCDELEASIKESQQHNELLLQQVLREALEPAGDLSADRVDEATADRPEGEEKSRNFNLPIQT